MKDTTAIFTNLYPHIEESMKKNTNGYKQCVARFMNTRSSILYSNILTTKPYFSDEDIKDFYTATKIDPSKAKHAIENTYYYSIGNFNPRYAKDDFVISMMCIIRYFKLKNMKKELELALIHLAFSGKYYTSIFHGSFPVTDPQEYIMEYVISHMTSGKFNIVKEGSLLGAIRSICLTWVNAYTTKFKEFHDDDVVYLVQQLHNRIRSFVNNIAELYYDAYEHKDAYVNYNADNVSDDDYHLADSDSFRVERIVEATMNAINNHGVNQYLCKLASNDLVSTEELRGILDNVISKNENLPMIKELCSLLVSTYFVQSKTKDVRDLDFITFSITAKPNTKDKSLLRLRELLTLILLNNSEKFKRRKSRAATENAYYRAMLAYFSLLIQNSNKSK